MYTYRKRIADEMLARRLRRIGAVQIVGPKWCGKTTTAERQAKSVVYLDEPGSREQNIRTAEINPSLILSGENPRLIDEWQIAPRLWDAVRYEVDHRHERGLYILTGSTIPNGLAPDENGKREIIHSGAGRVARMVMRPMSLFESGDSTGSVSLREIFASPAKGISGHSILTLEDVAYLLCRGGWPGSLDLQKEDALGVASDYFDVITRVDMSQVDGVDRNPERVRRLMRSYARNQGTPVSIGTLRSDMESNDDSSLVENTVSSYLSAMRKLFVVEDMPAWNPNLRSKTAIRTSDTRYFIDPSIATSALGLGPGDLTADLNTMGFLFETLCVRDLRVFADSMDGNVYHFRDKTGLECDAVVHLRNGEYGLVEIKLGGRTLIDEGASNLLALVSKIDTDKMRRPSFMMILTATGNYSYLREDGVLVVPIGCLKD